MVIDGVPRTKTKDGREIQRDVPKGHHLGSDTEVPDVIIGLARCMKVLTNLK